MRYCPLVLGLGMAIGLALTIVRADEPGVDSTVRIGRLIQQLGSDSFLDREQARKDLETIGAPALLALRKAMKLGDLETSRRAAELIRTIEEKVQTASMLAPKMVHLKVQDVPVLQAVDALAKLSGYTVRVDGDRTLMTGKKVTIDTGKVTFWEAVDQLGDAAGLVEKMTLAAIPGDPGASNEYVTRLLNYREMRPKRPGKKLPPPPPPLRLMPLPAKAKLDGEPEVKPPDATPEAATGGDAPPPKAIAKEVLERLDRLLAEQEAKDKPAGELAKEAAVPPPMVIPGVVILMPSATAKQHVSYAGAVRVVLKNAKPHAIKPKAAARHYDLVLDASAEPRLLGFGPSAVPTIARAIDEHGQALTFAIDPEADQPPAPSIPGLEVSPNRALFGAENSVPRGIAIRLQFGAKPAKRLKELTGTLPVQVLLPNETLMAHDLKAINKSTDIKGGGRLQLQKFEKTAVPGAKSDVDVYTVVYSLEGLPNGNIPNLVAVRGSKQVPINSNAIPELLDAKGNRLVLSQGPMMNQESGPDGQVIKTIATVMYRREAGQGAPVQLVLTGTYAATVLVPFRFVDVPLP